ncbi:BnaA02g17830D [Brassica napus]|uniref:BnaA02g17830D protein n=1 Tax=Brassica napus TaxID=3708 RepID=A0A078I769_BRANA|nr:BnaA02g17830D [Brassica napus]
MGGSGEDEKDMKMEEIGEVGGGGGNRWPRPETLALLRIRSEMDKAFRDSTLKAPLWEEVSRKMKELGYKRSAKKCKEKFENVYKYHKRTKEGRTGKSEGKTYRFFEELQALEALNSYPPEPGSQPLKSSTATTTQPSPTTPFPIYSNNHATTIDTGFSPTSNDLINNVSSLNLFSSSTSSSTASDEEEDHHHQDNRSRKKRKYWKGLFTKLTNELMEKQEKVQKRFLETFENQERERISREEAWRVQEVARINREHETLVHERSNAVAKDAVIISFLHKISGGQQQQQQKHEVPQRKQYHSEHSITFESKEPRPVLFDSNHSLSPSSSRWPKTEVEALIRIRKNLEANYQENGTRGPLWEEISGGMRRLGYNRSAKRCKEKWENINKYFKKVKESNKKRPLDSKTCPYFNQLEALYNERNKSGALSILPLMLTPQLLPQETQTEVKTDQGDKAEEGESEEDDYENEYEEGDNETSEFEILLNKSSPMD